IAHRAPRASRSLQIGEFAAPVRLCKLTGAFRSKNCAMLRPSVAKIAFDAALFDTLRGALARGELSIERSRLAEPPRPLADQALLDLADPAARDGWRARGEAALSAGKVAA